MVFIPKDPKTDYDDAGDNTTLTQEDIAGLFGTSKTYYRLQPKPTVVLQGQRVSPGFDRIKVTPEELLNTYFNLPTDQLIAVKRSLIDLGIKGLKDDGKLDTKAQIDAYAKGIKSISDSYATLIESTPDALLSKVPGTLEIFLQKSAVENKGKGPSVYDTVYLTTPEDAVQELNQFSTDYLGMVADPADAQEYTKRLAALEKKSFQRQTTSTVGGKQVSTITRGGVDQAEKEKLALDILGRKITVEGIKDVGGLIGSNLGRITKLASDYGLSLPNTDLRQYAINSVMSKTGLDDTVVKLKNMAKGLFPVLAPLIDQDISPREFLSPFIQLKSQIFGTPSTGIDITRDQDLISAMSGDKIPSLVDYGIKLRNKPEYPYTPQARQDASGIALKILQDNGFA
jgi:hypothetical protein